MIRRFVQMTLLVVLSLGAAGGAQEVMASCFDCHDQAAFQGKVVHAPLRSGTCQDCHSPHATRHDGLLLAAQQELCFQCHSRLQTQIESKAVAHAPVRQGECTACHAPHAAGHRNLLSGSLSQSCRQCHEDVAQEGARKHAPFAKGQCNVCHDPHAADDYSLIKQADPALCLGCHTQTAQLQNKHMGRSPQSMQCLECHNPHGGDRRALLRSNQHVPFAENDCGACHDSKQTGIVVCLECHEDVLETFNHSSNHLLGAGENNPCTNCHTPHASDQAGLMPGSPGSVCRDCHADTFQRRQGMLHQHPDWQDCASCHALHGSDYPTMLKDEPDKVCAVCHGRHTTFVHPIGEDALDPRNNRPMTCLTCHDPNTGTMFQYNLRGSGERGLCIECHQGY